MKIYKHSGVRYWFDIFKHLNSFDVVGIDELLMLHEKLLKWSWNLGVVEGKYLMNRSPFDYPPNHDKIIKYGGEYLYLELPHKFFDDYLIGWTHDICMIDTDNEKRVKCDCYKCINIVDYSWKEVKQRVLSYKDWVSSSSILYPEFPFVFKTIKKFGIAKPIYNYSPHWPVCGTHRIAFCSVLKSDIPFFFRIFDDDSENVYRGAYPYFKDKKYCHMKIMKNKKKVAFYLSSYWSNFDEDRDEKIGEISYK